MRGVRPSRSGTLYASAEGAIQRTTNLEQRLLVLRQVPCWQLGKGHVAMTWKYHQATGRLTRNGRVIAHGYSGHGTGRNNPHMESHRNMGPIPKGRYKIGSRYNTAHHGPHVMRLTPDGHNARGRSGILIHGDNRRHDASQGCIILPRTIRDTIATSNDLDLHVVE